MNQGTAYRQMELDPRTADGDLHSPEQMRLRMEQARKQAAFYEAQSQELEQSTNQKILFSASLNEVGMNLHNAASRLDKELKSMRAEEHDVELALNCMASHLKILSSLQPQTWSTEGFSARLHEAIAILDRAENDFNEAFRGGDKYIHTDVFRHKPGEEERERFGWRMLRESFLKGLAFHLPLFFLLLLTWLIYLFITLS